MPLHCTVYQAVGNKTSGCYYYALHEVENDLTSSDQWLMSSLQLVTTLQVRLNKKTVDFKVSKNARLLRKNEIDST